VEKTDCATVQLRILSNLGFSTGRDTKLLDFGCGNGELVAAYRRLGINAFGCDLQFKDGPHVQLLSADGAIRRIELPYRLPFPDNSFEVIVSDQVFEHVADIETSFSELRRVLKPAGICLHTFPSRYILREPHVGVPLAGLIQSRPWLYLWALLGVRMPNQIGLSAIEVSEANYTYLHRSTHYLSKSAIREKAKKYFLAVAFREASYLLHSRLAREANNLGFLLPLAAWLYSAVRMRTLVCVGKAALASTETSMQRDNFISESL